MAEKLKDFNFGPARSPRFDWDSWFDGDPWRLKKGEDFTSKTSSFKVYVYQVAKACGLKVRVSEDGDTVVIQVVGQR